MKRERQEARASGRKLVHGENVCGSLRVKRMKRKRGEGERHRKVHGDKSEQFKASRRE